MTIQIQDIKEHMEVLGVRRQTRRHRRLHQGRGHDRADQERSAVGRPAPHHSGASGAAVGRRQSPPQQAGAAGDAGVAGGGLTFQRAASARPTASTKTAGWHGFSTTAAAGNSPGRKSAPRMPVRKTNGVFCNCSAAATLRPVARRAAQQNVEHGDVEARAVAQGRQGLGGVGDAGHARRAGRQQDLLDVERDQQFVVDHQTAFAGEHGTRLRHEGLLQFLNGTFPCAPN